MFDGIKSALFSIVHRVLSTKDSDEMIAWKREMTRYENKLFYEYLSEFNEDNYEFLRLISVDNLEKNHSGNRDKYQILEDFDEYFGNYPHLVYSKRINSQLRFNYSIYRPVRVVKDGKTFYESRIVLEDCGDHVFRGEEYWGTNYPQKNRYKLKKNLVSIKPYKEKSDNTWWSYKAVVPKLIDTATKVEVDCEDKETGTNHHAIIFPKSKESNPLRPEVEKSSTKKVFKIKRVTPEKDNKYIYYKP